jgi:hypothetical protein
VRTVIRAFAVFGLVQSGVTDVFAQGTCRPSMALAEPHYTPMKLPKLERTWSLAFTVDASRCATSSGTFAILFTVFNENAPDIEFVETFNWTPHLNVISKEFWADEAVGAYTVKEIAPCPCSDFKQ